MGVSPNHVYAKIYESNSISSLMLQSRVLSSLELYYDDGVAVQTMLKETLIECNAIFEEADTLINIPLKSEKIRVSVFFKENREGSSGVPCVPREISMSQKSRSCTAAEAIRLPQGSRVLFPLKRSRIKC